MITSSGKSSSDPPEIITMKLVENNSVAVLMDGKGSRKSRFPLFWTRDPDLHFTENPFIVYCDGLFLIGYTDRCLMVCNPATRETAALPPTTYIPDESLSGAGIGLDRSTNKYKVVRIFHRQGYFERLQTYGIEVITLGGTAAAATSGFNSWRLKGYLPPYITCTNYTAATVRGAAYWTIFGKSDDPEKYNFSRKMSILRFDLSNEDCTVIDAPDQPRRVVLSLSELKGRLCCYGHALDDRSDPTICVWLSNDDLVGWTLLYTVEFDSIFGAAPSFMPITIDQKGCLFFKFLKRMHCYNPRTNQYYKMGDAYAPEITAGGYCCNTTSYVETIVPISSH